MLPLRRSRLPWLLPAEGARRGRPLAPLFGAGLWPHYSPLCQVPHSGKRVATILKHLFPVPKADSRRVVSMVNQARPPRAYYAHHALTTLAVLAARLLHATHLLRAATLTLPTLAALATLATLATASGSYHYHAPAASRMTSSHCATTSTPAKRARWL